MFGYTKYEGEPLTLDTIGHWLDAHPDRFDRVVINVCEDDESGTRQTRSSAWICRTTWSASLMCRSIPVMELKRCLTVP